MHILGISCYYHDAAAAILRDGQLVAAAEEERFSRVKHDFGFPKHAIEFCLREAKIDAKDVDYVVFYERPFQAGPPSDQRPANLSAILESVPRVHDWVDAGQAVDRQHAAIGVGSQPRPRAFFRTSSFARGERVPVLTL